MRRNLFLIIALLLASVLVFAGCDTGGSGGSSSSGSDSNITAEIDGVAPYLIDASGGTGDTGNGGGGGEVRISSYLDIEVMTTGSADASFTVPTLKPSYQDCSTIDEAANDLADQFAPTADITVGTYNYGDTLATGVTYYTLTTNSYIFIDSGDGVADGWDSDDEVDCMSIPSGVTVTLEANYSGGTETDISIYGDLNIAGTLTTTRIINTPVPFYLYTGSVFIPATGTIDLSGGDGTGADGGPASYLEMVALSDNMGTYIENLGTIDISGGNGASGFDGGDGGFAVIIADGRIVNEGTILGTGGTGDIGGDGGGTALFTIVDDIYNTGDIDFSGGASSAALGGAGGMVTLASGRGVLTSGDLSANGANGTDGGGGGGDLGLFTWTAGPFKVSGALDASGGDATTDGDGGDGGYLTTMAMAGPFAMSGIFDGSGGDGAGTGLGGAGGAVWNDLPMYLPNGNCDDWNGMSGITFGPGYMPYVGEFDGYPVPEIIPVQSALEMSMDIDVSGGDGEVGGLGGMINLTTKVSTSDDDWGSGWPTTLYDFGSCWDAIYTFLETDTPSAELHLYGYSDIDVSGGDSTSASGGDGGFLGIFTNNTKAMDVCIPAGSITIQPDIDVSGGTGSNIGIANSGGSGGEFYAYMFPEQIFDWEDWAEPECWATWSTTEELSVTTLSGAVDISGGNGYTGGTGGGFGLHGFNRVTFSGSAEASGGTGTTGNGGDANEILLVSSGYVDNNGTLTADGGSSTSATGGDGAYISLYAGQIVNTTAAISATGASGDIGGDGGYVDIRSFIAPDSNVTSTIDVTLGNGTTTDGENGYIFIDNMNMTPSDGSL